MGLKLIVQLILVCNVHYVLGQGTTPSTTKAPSSSAVTTAATPATTVSTVSTSSTASTGSPATTLSTVSSASTVSTVSAVTQPSTVATTITASPVTTSTSGPATSSTQTSVSATTGTTSSISTQQTPGTTSNNGNGATTASTISTVSTTTSSTTVSSATPSSSVSTQQTPVTTASSVSTQQTPGTTASTVSTPQTPSTCTANQTFASVGFDCFTCANQTGQCRIKTEEKCYCNQGYVLSKTGCVLPIDCKADDKCIGNETYATSGIDCLTCGNYKDATCGPINMSKCYCNIGYVRNDEGKCVKMGDCPVNAGDCKVNQTMQNSGFDCLTCDNYNDTNIQCGLVNERKCFCNNGYYRTADRQRCVLPQDCNSAVQPNSCSTNETYSASGNECKCGAQQCPFTRGPKCYCNSGFYRTPTGGCVLQQDCPSDVTCKSLAERECNGGCIRTCGRTYTRRLRCPAVCNSCLCPFGQLRDDYSGLCIAVKSCPNTGYIFPNFVYNP